MSTALIAMSETPRHTDPFDYDWNMDTANTGSGDTLEALFSLESISETSFLSVDPELQRASEPIEAQTSRMQPTDREQDLEAAFSLVWDLLNRSGSAEAQPGTSAHRVLQRLVPELVSRT